VSGTERARGQASELGLAKVLAQASVQRLVWALRASKRRRHTTNRSVRVRKQMHAQFAWTRLPRKGLERNIAGVGASRRRIAIPPSATCVDKAAGTSWRSSVRSHARSRRPHPTRPEGTLMGTDHFLSSADVVTDARVVVCLTRVCVSPPVVDAPLVLLIRRVPCAPTRRARARRLAKTYRLDALSAIESP
jgi:hypothetical protein